MTSSLKPFEKERFLLKLLLSKSSSLQPYDCSQNVSSMRYPYNLHQSAQWYLQHVSPYLAFLARSATSIFSPWMPVGRTSFVRKKHPSACPSCPCVLISAQSRRHCQQNWWLHCEPTKNTQQMDHASEQGWNLTSHMKACFPFLDPDLTARTIFRICPNPFSRLRKTRIAMVPLTFVFIACQSVMPRHFVSEAHLEAALLARDFRVDRGSLIQLTIFTEWCETPAKTWVIGEKRLQKKLLISNALSETPLKHARKSWAYT